MMFLGYRVVSHSDGEAWFCIKLHFKLKWLSDEVGAFCQNFASADLSYANLHDTDLHDADLRDSESH